MEVEVALLLEYFFVRPYSHGSVPATCANALAWMLDLIMTRV